MNTDGVFNITHSVGCIVWYLIVVWIPWWLITWRNFFMCSLSIYCKISVCSSLLPNFLMYYFSFWFTTKQHQFSSVQFTQSCPALCDPMNRSTPGLPVHHQLPEFTQTHVHWVGDAIQPSHPLSSPSPPVLNLSQHQGLFKWVSSSHQVAKVLEFQLQHQSFQWTPRADLL